MVNVLSPSTTPSVRMVITRSTLSKSRTSPGSWSSIMVPPLEELLATVKSVPNTADPPKLKLTVISLKVPVGTSMLNVTEPAFSSTSAAAIVEVSPGALNATYPGRS